MIQRGALVTCLAAALLVSGCGQAVTKGAASELGPAEDRLSALYMRISGDPAHRSMAQFVTWSRVNEEIGACMEGQGLPYQATFVDAWIGHAPTITTEDTWAAPLRWTIVGDNARGAVPKDRLLQRLMESPERGSIVATKEYQGQLDECQLGAKGDLQSRAVDYAPLLGALYQEVIIPAGTAAPSVGEYEECMADSGFAVTDGEDGGYQGLLELLDRNLPPEPAIPAVGESPTAAWVAYLTFEKHALDADAGCRQAGHAAAMTAMLPLLDEFTEKHPVELSDFDREWMAVADEARERGWTPDPYGRQWLY